ncbi:MAG: ribonuclease HII [Armatimonadota bacterium]
MTQSSKPSRHRKLPRAASRGLEKELAADGFEFIAGVDEAGCGALAGPVVAAAVILPVDLHIKHLTDSKRLPADYRASLIEQVQDAAVSSAFAMCPHHVIDRINIYRARLLAMQRALNALSPAPDIALIDGHVTPPVSMPTRAVVNGDRKCRIIAAASIIAKVTRDHIMERIDALYPQYGFARHKGYATAEHTGAISAFGACPVHRLSFAQLLRQQQSSFDFSDGQSGDMADA